MLWKQKSGCCLLICCVLKDEKLKTAFMYTLYHIFLYYYVEIFCPQFNTPYVDMNQIHHILSNYLQVESELVQACITP